jgi:hypothetical protein
MPRAVVNVYGVMKALQPDKDVGFVVLRKHWFFVPYVDDFVEISLSNGKLVHSK